MAFTPIRLNNVRLPNKNLRDLGGMPLLNWAIKSVDAVKDVDNYIWCSKPSVMKSVVSQKVRLMRRPKSLDEDNVLGEDIYRSFVSRVEADAYLLYHVTSPLMKPRFIREAVDAVTKKGYDSAFSVFPIQTFCWYQGKPVNFSTGKLPRTQDLEPVHRLTSGFFLFTREVLLQGGSRIGQRPKEIIVDQPSAIDIDYFEDLQQARALIGDTIAQDRTDPDDDEVHGPVSDLPVPEVDAGKTEPGDGGRGVSDDLAEAGGSEGEDKEAPPVHAERAPD